MGRVVDVDHGPVYGTSHHDVPELSDVSAFDWLVVVGQGGAQAGGEAGIRLQARETGQWYSVLARATRGNGL